MSLIEPFVHTIEVSEIIKFSHPKPWDDSSFLTSLYVNKGWSLRRISKELGCSKSVVRKKLLEAGIICFKQIGNVDFTLKKKINTMREKGMSYQKITDLLNLWRIETRSKDGRWHVKTIRDLCD